MIATREPIVPSAEPKRVASDPDLGAVFETIVARLSASVEGLVAQAFAAHADAHRLPLPAVVKRALAAPEPREPVPTAPVQTGNAGLDFLNEHLHRSVPTLGSPSAVPTPPWLHPFTLPEKVRFTRTPDPVMRWERSAPTAEELAEAARTAAAEAARQAYEDMQRVVEAAPAESEQPTWRRPFQLPPNVRYTRTPDTQPRQAGDAVPEGAARTVTVTQTVTTVESVSYPSPEAQAAEMRTIDAAPVPASPPEVASSPAHPVFSVSASFAPRPVIDAGLPAWLLPPVEVQSFVAPAPVALASAAPATVESDPDSEGSAALFRSFAAFDDEPVSVWAEPEEAAPSAAEEPTVDLLANDNEADVWSVDEVAEPFLEAGSEAENEDGDSYAPPVVPERRAFASHGLSAFENAIRYDTDPDTYDYPDCDLLAPPQKNAALAVTRESLEQNARLLEGVLEDFGIRGEIIAVRPGPVVTLYEFEPAPGVKSSRVMNLADDIARSMSAVSARVAVVQGRNVIGIELPNEQRETVFLRELVGSDEFDGSGHKLAIALGKTIGGESVIVDLARMPHLLVAGTTGSGKSVAINTMILSLLYRLRPEECRLIMVDPKMLELSIYDGIPHLLTPVVTDSKKAVIALKWAVREMEDRYKKMAKVGVRNIDGFNARVTEAKEKGEVITRTIQQGFDRETGEPMFETEEMNLDTLPYVVIVVDEMADLMMVAGKEIEGAIQRLAQMARAAGIHLIMATQRPSVDVITGTIKANFPTRISFQVTSKIDSRTILGEQGAEQLLGQGDMLHMAGGGRIVRVHGPFVSDGEVEKVVQHLKAQGRPEYLDIVTSDGEDGPSVSASSVAAEDEEGESAVFDRGNFADESTDLYEQGVKIVLRDKKCSTSYIQRRLQVGYNKAASIVERMEKEGLVGPANPTGKREILNFSRDHSRVIFMRGDD